MMPEIISLQELVSHQQEELARLSHELFTQQREIIALRGEMSRLTLMLKAATQNDSPFRSPDQETPPPHY